MSTRAHIENVALLVSIVRLSGGRRAAAGPGRDGRPTHKLPTTALELSRQPNAAVQELADGSLGLLRANSGLHPAHSGWLQIPCRRPTCSREARARSRESLRRPQRKAARQPQHILDDRPFLLSQLRKKATYPIGLLPELNYPFHDRDVLVAACGRLCLHRKRINISWLVTDQASRRSATAFGLSASCTMISDT